MDERDLQHRFAFHPAGSDDIRDRHEAIRDVMLRAAAFVNGVCPDGREKSLAVTHLEEAMMWANASVARGQGVLARELAKQTDGGSGLEIPGR